ncbi:MAG: hypothetical protein NT062_34420 [Proteobacteria bacterium]|nr:hypothetical protein [Pseudomonadota bacterium]
MRRIITPLVTLASLIPALSLVSACDAAYDPGTLAIDPNAPTIEITEPAMGTLAGDVAMVTVKGRVHDDVGVTAVTVNGMTATLSGDRFSVDVPVGYGTQLLHAVALDADGNQGKETRAVSAGPTRSLTTQVPQAVMASISAQTFDAISRGATNFVKTADLTAMLAPSNPIISVGGADPDCLYGHGAITSLTLGDFAVSMSPTAGGLYLDATFTSPFVGMHLDYAAACIDGQRDVSAAASRIHIAGLLAMSIGPDGKLVAHINNPDVSITGLDLELGGIPGDVVNLIHLDTAIGPILAFATEKFVAPMLANAIEGSTDSQVSVLGTTVNVEVRPTKLDFDVTGAMVELDTKLRAEGDSILTGFVYVPNTAPVMSTSNGFEVAVSDDAVNQLLTSLWTAKAFDKAFDLDTGSYGEVGRLYDRVEIAVAAPPWVDASGAGLKLVLGDMTITFKNGNTVATKVVANAEIDLKATAGTDGKLRLDAGQPTVFVDLLNEGVSGANDLSSADFEHLVSFALSRAVSFGAGAVGAIPLPSVGGVGLKNLSIDEQTGYLVVGGSVE